MPNIGGRGGNRGSGVRRSVGAAAAGGHPNGAILSEDDAAKFLRRRKLFDDWKKDRKPALKVNPMLAAAQSLYGSK